MRFPAVSPNESGKGSEHDSISVVTSGGQTFPKAIAEVAMSSWKLSPAFAGAATARGLVPIDGYKKLRKNK